jgi:anti-sigma B factor antagonist
MTLEPDSSLPETARAVAIRRITDASELMTALGKARSGTDIDAARNELALAVGAARDLDVSWQTIGDALGMRRGAAYQRFRQRPPARTFAIHESPIDGVTVLSVRGELDALTVPELTEAINKSLVEVPMGLIIDLEEVTFLSSSGMNALIDADHTARSAGKRLAVVADSPTSRRPIMLMGIDQSLRLFPTVHSAMRGLHDLDGDAPLVP